MNLREIERCFDQAAPVYDQHDALEREVGERLIERIAFTRLEPRRILNLGCATGRTSLALKSRFPEAEVIGLDLSAGMLGLFQNRFGDQVGDRADARKSMFCVQADLTRLPFPARSTDLVFCNLALQWAGDFVQALNEIRRVLRPEGMMLFTVPGPDSLLELRQNPGDGFDSTISIYMPDLRDVGDCLVAAGFRDPVMDSELLTLSYRTGSQMKAELAATGGAGFAEISDRTAQGSGVEISFEIVYGVAFGPADGQPVRTQGGEVVTFPADQLKKL